MKIIFQVYFLQIYANLLAYRVYAAIDEHFSLHEKVVNLSIYL
jgi:hypothetical protein